MIPITKPLLAKDEADAAERAILSGWVTQGPEVAAFEAEFSSYVGAQHACAVSNGTAALHLALHALDLQPGDEIITVSHSFIATANAVRYCNAKPVFVDVELGTYNLDPQRLQAAYSDRSRGILCVHQLGMPCDMQQIIEFANAHNLPVIEDAACAIGSEINWQGRWERVGRPHGLVACFSFHPRKLLTTGDGGMLTTSAPELDRRFRLYRQHAMSVPDAARHTSGSVVFEEYRELGFNYRMTDIQGAIGRVQLTRISLMVARRREMAALYRHELDNVDGIILPDEPDWARSNWQSYCVQLTGQQDQRAVMQKMLNAGVATRRGVSCAHREPAYAGDTWKCELDRASCECEPGSCAQLANSKRLQDYGLILPLFPQMTTADQYKVVVSLKEALAQTVRHQL